MFGKPKTTKEIVKENKTGIKRNQRDLDRDLLSLDREEQKIQNEIKRLAKANQIGSAKVLAKEIVRIRKQREKLVGMKAKLSSQMSTMAAQQTVATSMVSATRAVHATNLAMPMQQTQRVAAEFQKQSEMASMKEEMMDDVFDDPDEEEEVDETVAAVLDSIGLDVSEQMSKAKVPTNGLKTTSKVQDKELQAMLDKL